MWRELPRRAKRSSVSEPEFAAARWKIESVPGARVRHQGRASYSTVERADFLLSRAVFIGKYQGLAAGLQARMGSVFGPLFGLRLGELKYTISGQKIDGTQE